MCNCHWPVHLREHSLASSETNSLRFSLLLEFNLSWFPTALCHHSPILEAGSPISTTTSVPAAIPERSRSVAEWISGHPCGCSGFAQRHAILLPAILLLSQASPLTCSISLLAAALW